MMGQSLEHPKELMCLHHSRIGEKQLQVDHTVRDKPIRLRKSQALKVKVFSFRFVFIIVFTLKYENIH